MNTEIIEPILAFQRFFWLQRIGEQLRSEGEDGDLLFAINTLFNTAFSLVSIHSILKQTSKNVVEAFLKQFWDSVEFMKSTFGKTPDHAEYIERVAHQIEHIMRIIMGMQKKAFSRITIDPKVMEGRPCIRGLRFPVSRLLGLLAAGETVESILQAYPYLTEEDVKEALLYAAVMTGGEIPEDAE